MTMSGDVFPNIQRKYCLRTRELGKTVLKGFLVALRNPDAYYYIVGSPCKSHTCITVHPVRDINNIMLFKSLIQYSCIAYGEY